MKKILYLSLLSCISASATQFEVKFLYTKPGFSRAIKKIVEVKKSSESIQLVNDEFLEIDLTFNKKNDEFLVQTDVYEKKGGNTQEVCHPVLVVSTYEPAEVSLGEETNSEVSSLVKLTISPIIE